MRRVEALACGRGHGFRHQPRVPPQPRILKLPPQALTEEPHALTEEQRGAFEYAMGEGDIKALAAAAGNGKSVLLAAMREAWEIQGLSVIGVALSRIAAETLQASSGIPSQTLATQELEWQEGGDPFTLNPVTVGGWAEV